MRSITAAVMIILALTAPAGAARSLRVEVANVEVVLDAIVVTYTLSNLSRHAHGPVRVNCALRNDTGGVTDEAGETIRYLAPGEVIVGAVSFDSEDVIAGATFACRAARADG